MLYNLKFSSDQSGNTFYFNKIINSRANKYAEQYKQIEIENILLQLRDIDLYLKSTSLKEKLLFHPLFIGICKGIYA